MFQEYALFPHRDVFGNVSFGLRMAGMDTVAIQEQVAQALELVGLEGFEGRDVNQLSGGERQRVALARSLAPQPCLLMLDEPLGALDRALRERLLEELPAILKRVGVTTITVTHDQGEAFAIADRVILMDAGRVVQQGTPEQVYREPTSVRVARFLGLDNLLEGRVLGNGQMETALGVMEVETDGPWKLGEIVTLLVRPEAIRLSDEAVNKVTGKVAERVFRGSHYQVALRFEADVEMEFEWPYGQQPPALGERLTLWLNPQGLTIVPD
jgi:ABC-type Fe3+/spermidine/putrescine transport system ATPase subunit